MQVIRVTANSPPLDGQREGVGTGEMDILLEVGGIDEDIAVKMTMIQVHIDIQNCYFRGGGMSSPSL